MVVWLNAGRPLPCWGIRYGGENGIRMIAIAAVSDRAAVQSAPQFAGKGAVGSVFRFLGDSADLDLTLPLDKIA